MPRTQGTAVVTGAACEVGVATGRRLVAEGYEVFLVTEPPGRVEQFADAIDAALMSCDVTAPDLLRRLEADARGIDVLVYCTDAVAARGPLLNALSPRAAVVITVAAPDGTAPRRAVGTGATQRMLIQSLRAELAGSSARISEVVRGNVHDGELRQDRHRDENRVAAGVRSAGAGRPCTADDIARAVSFVAALPPHITVSEIVLRPAVERPRTGDVRASLDWAAPALQPTPKWL